MSDRSAYRRALDYAVDNWIPFWCDSDLVVYISDGKCVVAAEDQYSVLQANGACHQNSDACIVGDLLWHVWCISLGGAQSVAYKDYLVVYGNGSAAIAQRGAVDIIGRATMRIVWDRTDEGKRAIAKVVGDVCCA